MKRFLFLLFVMLLVPRVCYALDLSAKYACVMSLSDAEVIYEKDSHVKAPMASTTKMMTALIAAESEKWDEFGEVSVNAQNQEGSKIYLKAGEKIKISELVCGLLLNSGNDAAVAIAENIGGSTQVFAEMMTKRANEIGAYDTQFMNPSGLDEEGHYSTAYDLALIGREVILNERLSEIVKTKTMKIENAGSDITYLQNHNKLLWNYDGAIGIKTGFTKKSGRCLVSAAKRGDVVLVAVTINAPDDWNDHKKLLDYGFEKCSTKTAIKKGDTLAKIEVGGEHINLVSSSEVKAISINGRIKECDVVLYRVKSPEAPINAGEKLGQAEVYQNGYLIGTVELLSDREVYENKEKESIINKILLFFKNILH